MNNYVKESGEESTHDSKKFSVKELQECSDKGYPFIFAKNNKTHDAFESELKRFDDMIAYAKEQREDAPEKAKLKDVLKDAHKNGMRAGTSGAVFGQAGITSAVSTQKNAPLNKFGWNIMIDNLEKNKNRISQIMSHSKLKNETDNVITEACKDITTARKFVSEVSKLAKKYDANYFIVTDGASGINNSGNPAVKHARDSHIEWEKSHNFDPYEDWSNTTESTKNRTNDKGETVPEKCPKCGSDIGVFLRGEPVFLCTNKKCNKYFGTLPFPKHIKESVDYNNIMKTYKERTVDMINTDNIVDNMFLEFFGESSNGGDDKVPDKIEPVVKTIESKGYQVKYASPGYHHTRFDNDRNKDGVINDKLVTTGRIIFSRNYKFKNTPEGWEWKVLENGVKALYVKKYTYNEKMGTEKQAFEKWQNRYLNSIKTWAAELPHVSTSDSADTKPDENFNN